MIQSSSNTNDQNLEVIKEEFRNQVQDELKSLQIKEFIFVNCETPIFAIFPNDVMIASLGAMKDMITDHDLLAVLCGLEKANRALKSQFKDIGKLDNFHVFRANTYKYLGMQITSDDVQTIKNILLSSFSTFELIEAVSIQLFFLKIYKN